MAIVGWWLCRRSGLGGERGCLDLTFFALMYVV